MKNILFLAVALVFISCDTRKDLYEDLNKTPQLSVRKLDNNFVPVSAFQTTMNDSFKISQGSYNFEYYLIDDQITPSIQIKTEIIGSGQFVNNSLQNIYVYKPNTIGFSNITLKAMDAYGKSTNSIINLTVFDNLAPISVLNYQNTAVLDPLEYRLKADQSFDRDAKFGGIIINYEFSISPTYQVTTPYNYINYIFPSSGIYQVSLRVQDNDYVWSPSQVIYINVN